MPGKRFADLNPAQRLNLSGLPAEVKSRALEAAYGGSYTGCFLPTDDGPMGSAARYYEDQFRDTVGRKSYLFESIAPAADTFRADTAEGWIASKPSYETWVKQRAQETVDWLFGVFQDSGCCVDASLVELLHGLLGTRAADLSLGEIFQWLAAFYAYAFRGSCGQGWYMGAAATVTIEQGYCLALPEIAGHPYLREDDSERLVTSTWCRHGPPASVRQFVQDQGWRFEPGAISKFSGGVDALKTMLRSKGQLHHGSNYTSASSVPNKLKRIGGHAQTMFGGDWSDVTLRFFAEQGIRYTADDFPCVHHQTWGTNWSGAVADRYWPAWWGPKPQGAWICSAKQVVQYLSSGYVYLPKMRGTPGAIPPTPASDVSLTGDVYAENGGPIRGVLKAKTTAGETAEFILIPAGHGVYRPVPKIL